MSAGVHARRQGLNAGRWQSCLWSQQNVAIGSDRTCLWTDAVLGLDVCFRAATKIGSSSPLVWMVIEIVIHTSLYKEISHPQASFPLALHFHITDEGVETPAG